MAEYLHGSFYTEAARLRNAPPRVELARLTGDQFRRSVLDLGTAFTGDMKVDPDRRGLDAEYRKSNGPPKKRTAYKRVEPTVDVAFPHGPPPEPGDEVERGPGFGQLGEDGFTISWRGALLPPVTGEYELVADAAGSVEMSLNGVQVISDRVLSGDKTRRPVKAFFIAGKPVPVRLEVGKRLGERFDTKAPETDFLARLLWTVPHRAEEVVPERHLLPGWFPEALIVFTPFPPDDASAGYERGTAVSAAWDEAATEAAFEVADRLLDSDDAVRTFLKIREKDDDASAFEKAREFCETWAARAFRRPLTDEQRATYIDAHFIDGRPWKDAVRRCVVTTLKSPYFLYPTLHRRDRRGRRGGAGPVRPGGDPGPDAVGRAAGRVAAERREGGEPRRAVAGRVPREADERGLAGDRQADGLLRGLARPRGGRPDGQGRDAVPRVRPRGRRRPADQPGADDRRRAGGGEGGFSSALWNADYLYLNARLAEILRGRPGRPGGGPGRRVVRQARREAGPGGRGC